MAAAPQSRSIDALLEDYDELLEQGSAPDPKEYASAYPQWPQLEGLLLELCNIHGDLDCAAQDLLERRPPQRLGDYRLLEEIGAGGMGRVYLAQRVDSDSTTRYALKVLQHENDAAKQRFGREARLAQRLSHVGIAKVIDFDMASADPEGWPYIVSEYTQGAHAQAWARDKWPAGQPDEDGIIDCLVLVAQVADGLAHAHALDIIHRDIKPSNIMVDTHGLPKLIDFGLARELRHGGRKVTRTGVFVGSQPYAPPEQLSGDRKKLGKHSDTYALGATLFQLLTGRQPWNHEPLVVRCAPRAAPKHDCAALNPQVSSSVTKFVAKAMNSEIPRRFKDGAAFATALRRVIKSISG